MQASGSGHTLFITGPVDFTGGGNLVSSTGAILDLRTTTTSGGTGGFINPNGGEVDLNAATLSGPVTIRGGAVKVIDNSTMTGSIVSSADITINSSKQLNMSGATVSIQRSPLTGNPYGSLTNNGTFIIGAGTLDNAVTGPVAVYNLNGTGSTTLAGGTISSTGGGGFTSTNAFSGYGNLSALFTNNGSMNITGGILNVSGSGQIKGTGDVTISGSGLNLQNGNSLLASNFSMGPTATLQAGANTPGFNG